MKADLVIKNIGQLVTMSGPARPRTRKDINNFQVIKNGCIVVMGERISAVGTEDILKEYEVGEDTYIYDAEGKCVTPGLVDPHVHLIFYGWRENELALKLEGLSYIEILERGGGILSTVRNTRKATEKELFDHTMILLDRMLAYGTTTAEAKSGYGLSLEDELKSLWVIRDLDKEHCIDLVPTFLGAHAVPEEFIGKAEQYVDLIVDEMIPKVAENNLAEFCDVFCEEGVFTVEDSRRILNEGKKYGLKPKIHADELVSFGGAELAAEVGAISAEHLLRVSEEGIKVMAKKGVIANLLPGTPFYLMLDNYAPAQKMLEAGVPVALATDLNPGTSATESLQIIMNLASLMQKMTSEEIITGVTINAAYSVGLGDEIGSLEPGKLADIVIWDSENIDFLIYHFGVNLVDKVFKRGKLVVEKGQVLGKE